MSLKIIRQFGVVDWRGSGEPRRRFGVPPNGPWDTEAANVARMLAGLGSEEPVLEVLQGSIELKLGSPGLLAIAGTDGKVLVQGREFPLATRLSVRANEIVAIQAQCAYVVFASGSGELAKLDWSTISPTILRFLTPGSAELKQMLTVSRAFSRAGVRLEGLLPESLPELPSEPSCVGAIQRTPSGELIIIGPDGPTIGGYPKLGTIIEADLPLVPRLRIGQEIELHAVSWSEAMIAYDRRYKEFQTVENLWKLSQSE